MIVEDQVVVEQHQFEHDKNKYKWTAYYSDGTQLSQFDYSEDLSRQPGFENRGAYYDVNHSQLICFMITNGEHEYAVELSSGHFLVDGISFRMHSAEEEFTNFRLFWRKRSWHVRGVNRVGEVVDLHRVAFRIGWKANDILGNLVYRIMEID